MYASPSGSFRRPSEDRIRHGTLTLIIADDGRGFELARVSSGRLGISSMRERAASIGANLKLRSIPGAGTTVTVTWNGTAEDAKEAQ